MTQILQSLWAWVEARRENETGATAIEYGLLAALISVMIIGGAGLVGTNLAEVFGEVADALTGA